jgi:disulfide bond formation protein DsbB
MTLLRSILGRTWPLIAALAAAAMLGVAHAAETFGHLAPCELCLKQREVYWAALWVGLLGWRLDLLLPGRRWAAIFSGVLALIFLFQVGLAGYHAGVEWKWWPGPQSCTGQGKASVQALTALLSGAKIRGPSCDVAAWRGLGLSMAGWNALAAAGLVVLSLVACMNGWRRKDA